MGILKSFTAATGRRSTSQAAHAERFMQAHARGTMTFATEGEAKKWMLRLLENKWDFPSGRGSPDADLLAVSEFNEEIHGLSGPAGTLLRRSLESEKVGLKGAKIFFTCIQSHSQEPGPRLMDLIVVLRPKVVLLLGTGPAKALGMNKAPQLRPEFSAEVTRQLRVMVVTRSPASVLSAKDKRNALSEFLDGLVLAKRGIEEASTR